MTDLNEMPKRQKINVRASLPAQDYAKALDFLALDSMVRDVIRPGQVIQIVLNEWLQYKQGEEKHQCPEGS